MSLFQGWRRVQGGAKADLECDFCYGGCELHHFLNMHRKCGKMNANRKPCKADKRAGEREGDIGENCFFGEKFPGP